jgi:hypothetical protein
VKGKLQPNVSGMMASSQLPGNKNKETIGGAEFGN